MSENPYGSDIERIDHPQVQTTREHDKDMLIAGFKHDLKKANAEIARLRTVLEMHDKIARQEENAGDHYLWSDDYMAACEATRTALSGEEKP